MIGILIIAHGPLGESLIHSASHVMGGRPPLLDQLGIGMHDDPAALLPRARRLVNELDQGQGVLILSDIYAPPPATSSAGCLNPAASKAWPASTCRCWCVP